MIKQDKLNESDCIFCKIIAGELPAAEVYRDVHCIVVMDIFPISKGHMLIIPFAHHQYVDQLPQQPFKMRSHIFEIGSKLSKAVIDSSLNAKATNLLINNGKAANQHVPHVHLHIIPRYKNDNLNMLVKLVFKPLFMLKPGNPKKINHIRDIIKREATFNDSLNKSD